MRSNNEKFTKIPYTSPKLSVYGDIREITKNSVGPTKNFDNLPSANKTNT